MLLFLLVLSIQFLHRRLTNAAALLLPFDIILCLLHVAIIVDALYSDDLCMAIVAGILMILLDSSILFFYRRLAVISNGNLPC